MRVPVQFLGQSGWKIKFPGAVIYIDPYLSNSVAELDAPDLIRLKPIPFLPSSVCDADFILITHDHLDHCDPHTLPGIAKASPSAQFIGPKAVIKKLIEWGISSDRLHVAQESWSSLGGGALKVCAVPAAHLAVSRDDEGYLSCVGYLIDFNSKKIYFSGDTCLCPEVINAVMSHAPIHTAVLPVNEHNYYRAERGIAGNLSIREAFQFAANLSVKNMVAVHWDMFEANSAFPEEIRLIYSLLKPNFSLLIEPHFLNLGETDISIVIRTLNEAKYLESLLLMIKRQQIHDLNVEVVIVDSGSTDKTLDIARRHECCIINIAKEDFSFGRSLNMGCSVAAGDILVIVSGHCVPVDEYWLQKICKPLLDGDAQYVYGRQYGGAESYFSECKIFEKYFSGISKISDEDFFCNNANSAINKDVWSEFNFDEELTGLEDMELAQRLIAAGGRVAYVAEAGVYHYHFETWRQVRRRFEREAMALQRIMPQLHISFFDAIRYIATSCYMDWLSMDTSDKFSGVVLDIFLYRFNQYMGAWRGNRLHRKLSYAEKEKYFFPK